MWTTYRLLTAFNLLVFAAHFLRAGALGTVAAVLSFGALLFVRHAWARIALQGGALAATAIWLDITATMIRIRMAMDAPWMRLAAILGAVTALAAASALLAGHRAVRRRYARHPDSAVPSAVAFFLTFGLLATVQLVVARPLLLPERFVPGGGWLAAVALACYAAVIVHKMRDPRAAPVWRKRIWLLFSAVFFGQLALGMAGVDRLLMTGKLHVPVPAVILAGPLYRGEGFFMPILLAVTLVLVGPAWCSHLCYFGSLDLWAATAKKRPAAHPAWYRHLRIGLLALTIAAALGARLAGLSPLAAAAIALTFGIAGIATMVLVSRRRGTMFHCAAVCPIGLVAVWAGKISPFRVRFTQSCTGCGACGPACRMGALDKHHIRARTVGINCTLCGDCLSRCRESGIGYHLGTRYAPAVRTAFLVVVVSLHAVFLAVARV